MALPDTPASSGRIPPRRQLASPRPGNYFCAPVRGEAWRKCGLFSPEAASAILAPWPDFARNARRPHPPSLRPCSAILGPLRAGRRSMTLRPGPSPTTGRSACPTRDQAHVDAERAQAMLESSGQQAITPAMVRKFARTARERMHVEGGGYRRGHLRALAQRVEVADKEVRIMGSKGDLLRTLAAGSDVTPATPGVRSSVLKWRRERDSNPR
jgi:hypothetical protein